MPKEVRRSSESGGFFGYRASGPQEVSRKGIQENQKIGRRRSPTKSITAFQISVIPQIGFEVERTERIKKTPFNAVSAKIHKETSSAFALIRNE